MKNKMQDVIEFLPTMLAASLLTIAVGCVSGGGQQTYAPQQSYQPAYSPPPQTPGLSSTLPGSYVDDFDASARQVTLTIQPNLNAYFNSLEDFKGYGYVRVTSANSFQFISGSENDDFTVQDNNTILYQGTALHRISQ